MARTWGNIQYELDKAIRLEEGLWKGYILTAYQQILDLRQWLGLREVFQLLTIPADRVGTVTATQGSTAIVGVGTAWDPTLTRMRIQIAAGLETYGVEFTSATTGVLDRVFESEDVTGETFAVYRQNYALPQETKSVTRIIRPGYTKPLAKVDRGDMLGHQLEFGDPIKWAMGLDVGTDPAYKTVDLFYVPDLALVLNVEYQKAVEQFTGRNSNASPLPWVSDDAIILGAKMLAAMDDPRRDPSRYAGAYNSVINAMHEAENQRIGPVRTETTDEYNAANIARAEFYSC